MEDRQKSIRGVIPDKQKILTQIIGFYVPPQNRMRSTGCLKDYGVKNIQTCARLSLPVFQISSEQSRAAVVCQPVPRPKVLKNCISGAAAGEIGETKLSTNWVQIS